MKLLLLHLALLILKVYRKSDIVKPIVKLYKHTSCSACMHSAILFKMSEHLIGLPLTIFSCFQFTCKLDFSSNFTLPYDLGIILM